MKITINKWQPRARDTLFLPTWEYSLFDPARSDGPDYMALSRYEKDNMSAGPEQDCQRQG
jgi:hypothetical protein